jgi:hypothetical protein
MHSGHAHWLVNTGWDWTGIGHRAHHILTLVLVVIGEATWPYELNVHHSDLGDDEKSHEEVRMERRGVSPSASAPGKTPMMCSTEYPCLGYMSPTSMGLVAFPRRTPGERRASVTRILRNEILLWTEVGCQPETNDDTPP